MPCRQCKRKIIHLRTVVDYNHDPDFDRLANLRQFTPSLLVQYFNLNYILNSDRVHNNK